MNKCALKLMAKEGAVYAALGVLSFGLIVWIGRWIQIATDPTLNLGPLLVSIAFWFCLGFVITGAAAVGCFLLCWMFIDIKYGIMKWYWKACERCSK